MTQILLPAKFHRFKVSGLFFIHKNRRVQFFYETRCSGKTGTFCRNLHFFVL